jgi:hypothetical protein
MKTGKFEDVRRDYRTVNNYCIDGNCSRCGECCSDFIPLLDNELRIIKEYVKKHGVTAYKNRAVYAYIDITCPFYDAGKKECRIYPVRPSICRTFQCDKSFVELMRDKMEHFRNMQRSPVSLRHEIFGDPDPFRLAVELARREAEE